jgi:hypothetical protein
MQPMSGQEPHYGICVIYLIENHYSKLWADGARTSYHAYMPDFYIRPN